MSSRRVVVAGGGAAGIFAAIACAEAAPHSEVTVLEKGTQFLSKVRISGGGRCNVTHAGFDARAFAAHYPRGGQALIGALERFQASDTVAWFETRGVRLKTEGDGRMFPMTDSSQTVIDCLLSAARAAGVRLLGGRGLERAARRPEDGIDVTLSGGTSLACDRLLLATGGCRAPALGRVAVSLGHTLMPPVPSLFTFTVRAEWLRRLAGVSVPAVEVSVPGTRLREQGALLITHCGLSGPAILRLSAWGARELHQRNYSFPLQVNWLPHFEPEALVAELQSRRDAQPSRYVVNTPLAPLTARLWEQLVLAAGFRARPGLPIFPARVAINWFSSYCARSWVFRARA